MKRLACLSPNKTDATSLFRAGGPLFALQRKLPDLLIEFHDSFSWLTMKSCDAVFIQRPMLDSHVALVNLAKANRKPIIVDYDDDLFCVPPSNPTFPIYSKRKNQDNVVTILAKADVVMCSTPALAAKFRVILGRLAQDPKPEWNLNLNKFHVIPNAYDHELLAPLAGRKWEQPNKLVCWRGSSTHDKDLMLYTEAIANAFSKHLDWTFNFIGQPWWGTMQKLDEIPGIKPTNNIQTETLDPINYFDFLKTVKPALMIVPLEDIPFNRAKSNIAWLEAVHAGAVALAPDWAEWQRPGVITYKDPEDFEEKLSDFMVNRWQSWDLWDSSRDFVVENLMLNKVNALREVLIRGVMG